MSSFLRLVAVVLVSMFGLTAAKIKDTAADDIQKAWLEEYSQKDGVVVKESGLMYRIFQEGKGGVPGLSTPCQCHYEGRLTSHWPDGDTFDSSVKRGKPSTFAPRQVIKAWTEAMQEMPVGSKWELVCPPEIAYGARDKSPRIPPYSVLVFTMEMLSCDGVEDEL